MHNQPAYVENAKKRALELDDTSADGKERKRRAPPSATNSHPVPKGNPSKRPNTNPEHSSGRSALPRASKNKADTPRGNGEPGTKKPKARPRPSTPKSAKNKKTMDTSYQLIPYEERDWAVEAESIPKWIPCASEVVTVVTVGMLLYLTFIASSAQWTNPAHRGGRHGPSRVRLS